MSFKEARDQILRDHACVCEVCEYSSALCPASASSLIEELAVSRMLLKAVRDGVGPSTAHGVSFEVSDEVWEILEEQTRSRETDWHAGVTRHMRKV